MLAAGTSLRAFTGRSFAPHAVAPRSRLGIDTARLRGRG